MNVQLTPETSRQFRNYAEGFVGECHRRGATEKQAAALLEAHIPVFIATRSAHGREGARELVKFAMMGAAAKAVGGASRMGWKTPLGLGAAGLTALTSNPISDAMPSWLKDTVGGAAMGGLAGKLGGRVMGARGGALAGSLMGGGAGGIYNASKHKFPAEMDAAGYSPNYLDPSVFQGGNNFHIGNTSVGRTLDRARREMAALEAEMASIDVRAGQNINTALGRRMALAEKADLQKRHQALSRQVGRDLAGIQRDQGRIQADGAERLAGINTTLGNLTEDESAMERAFARSEKGGFGGLANELWLRMSGANGRAADLIGRRRALENQQRIEQNRASAQLLPNGWDS